jgi:UDP-glucose 4-epimerase
MERSIRNCNVAVIGGAGFLGTHLVKHLIEDRECFVVVIDNLISGQKDFIDKLNPLNIESRYPTYEFAFPHFFEEMANDNITF